MGCACGGIFKERYGVAGGVFGEQHDAAPILLFRRAMQRHAARFQVGVERGGILGLEGHAGKAADHSFASRIVVGGLDDDARGLFEQDRSGRRRGAVQPDDVLVECRGLLEVIDEYAHGCQAHDHAHFCLRWNMASIRCVTRKPPKILTDAKVSATKPSARAHSGPSSLLTSATPTASSAPTTITEEIALVTDISGVCSAGVTDHTT